MKLLQTNGVLTHMDLARNRIHINTLQVVLKLLKRRRGDTVDTNSTKKRFIRNWKNASLREVFRRNKISESVSKNGKRGTCRLDRLNRRSLKSSPLKRLWRFQTSSSRTKETKKRKKERNFEGTNLFDMELQLLDIINSNGKLKEELSGNDVLLHTEVQERSRTENELKQASLRLNDIRSKVLVVDSLRSKIYDENQLLRKGLRYVFEKMESFSAAKQLEVDKTKSTTASNDAELLSSPLPRRNDNIPASHLHENKPYRPPFLSEFEITNIVEY